MDDRIPEWARHLNLHHSTAPILAWRPEPAGGVSAKREHVGTGFFTSPCDFLTAKHLVEEFVARPSMLSIFPFDSADSYVAVPVLQIWPHPDCDLAFCRFAPDARPRYAPVVLPCSPEPLDIGEEVIAFGYAKTIVDVHEVAGGREISVDFYPACYVGTVDDHSPTGIGLARGPAYQWSGEPLTGGVSGGPVISRRTGGVHALVCSGSPEYATLTDVRAIVSMMEIASVREVREDESER